MSAINALVVTKGHPFERDPFFAMFDQFDINWTHVEQPAARLFFQPEQAAPYNVFVMYDMPGINFDADGPTFEQPAADYQQGLLDLLAAGKGMVFLHHALAGWPAWEEYAEILGGRFLYLPDRLRGQPCQDSGYRHEVKHRITVLQDHPVTAGLPKSFEMTDELYLAEIFTADVIPLLQSDYNFTRDNFYSAAKAIAGKMFDNKGWEHKDGSNLVGWIKTYGNSPIVYLQGGDDSQAYENQHYRTLVRNAIHWAADPDALNWAKKSKAP